MYFVYVLKSKSNQRYYIGYTADIDTRLAQHNSLSNPSRSTRNRGPWDIVYIEQFTDKKQAYEREKQIKSYKGGNAFKKLLGLI